MRPRNVWRVPAIVGLLSMPAYARADSFEVTGLDAADTFEIKPFLQFESVDEETVFEGPGLDLTAPLFEDVEISTKFGPGRISQAGKRARWGFIDTEFAMKWEIVPVPDIGGFGVTTEVAIIAPTGTEGLGAGEWRAELPVAVGWVSGPWELRGQIGYARGVKSGDDEVVFGALVKYALSETLDVGAEIAGAAENLGFAEYASSINVGLNWEFAPAIEFQARLGHSIGTRDHAAATNGLLAIEFGL